MIGLPEEVAFRMGYISASDIEGLAQRMSNNALGAYLTSLTHELPSKA